MVEAAVALAQQHVARAALKLRACRRRMPMVALPCGIEVDRAARGGCVAASEAAPG